MGLYLANVEPNTLGSRTHSHYATAGACQAYKLGASCYTTHSSIWMRNDDSEKVNVG